MILTMKPFFFLSQATKDLWAKHKNSFVFLSGESSDLYYTPVLHIQYSHLSVLL